MEGGGTGTRPFQAHAQVQLQGCVSTTNSIIQTDCANGSVYYNDLVQFESYKSFQADPFHYKLDPDLAAQFKKISLLVAHFGGLIAHSVVKGGCSCE